MARYKPPFEYELTPETLEKGTHWLTLRLKNKEDDDLQYLDVKMHSIDSTYHFVITTITSFVLGQRKKDTWTSK